jgi:hypothetical protein
MTRRVDRERSILGTELEELKNGRSGGRGGEGKFVENVTHHLSWEAQGSLALLAPGAAGWMR